MRTPVTLHVRQLGETSAADITNIWFFSSVGTDVCLEVRGRRERLLTRVTLIWSFSCMSSHVDRHVPGVFDMFPAYGTRVARGGWAFRFTLFAGICPQLHYDDL